ncbi:DUF2339 domain-containing protein [Marinobacter sp. X15-166B]|uniref:DUF2339 domain-containing protein n=1 Tax=Marinobacter sp. X15-166B TaxID=1897620 RepID=UPI00114D197D|nr:DUF2339 domain-containing protein [Marinobacter sp. X15-166B]
MLYAIVAISSATKNGYPVFCKAGMVLSGLVAGKVFLTDRAGLEGLWLGLPLMSPAARQ